MFARLKHAVRNDATVRAIRATYPALNWLRSRQAYYLRAAPYLGDMTFDDVRFSHRGNEPEAHLRGTRRLLDLGSADVLVVGAGSGDELRLWERQLPRSLTATDFFAQPGAWRAHDGARFAVDGATVLETDRAPRGPLGFVAWVDNQYMIATPRGRLGWGLLDAAHQWLELALIRIEPGHGSAS